MSVIELFKTIQPFVVSFLIGLFIGIERERSHPEGSKAAGVRTFILLALLGTFAATIHETVITFALTSFALAAILIGYFRSTQIVGLQTDIGLTTEFAAAAVYCLGYLTPQNILLSGIIAAIILFVLVSRKRLHFFSRHKINASEIQAAATLLIAALGILPFLPNYTIDPWNLLNPFRFGVLVILIATIQFGGYVAIRMFGERLGMVFMGFFGGLVSSTIVFVHLPKLVIEQPQLIFPAIAAGACSIIGTLLEFLIIISIASPPLFLPLLPSILAIIVTCIFITVCSLRNHAGKLVISKTMSPLDIKSVLKLALMIGGMLFFVGLAKLYLGTEAVEIIAFLGGLFELHSISLATALLNHAGKISLTTAKISLLLAVGASFISKLGILIFFARNKFGFLMSLALLLMLAIGTTAGILVYPYF